MTKAFLVPKAKPRDTNIPRVLLLLVNDSPNLLVPKAKPRNTNNISYYYLYSANMPNHLLMTINTMTMLHYVSPIARQLICYIQIFLKIQIG